MFQKTVLIYSGGLDSTVLLYRLSHVDQNEVLCLNFDYGSKHNERERISAMKICEKLGVQIQWIKYPFGKYLHSNLLKGGGDIPEGEYKDLSMKQTVVPFRNAIMLSLAVGIAESNGYERVSLAVHSGDHFIYPDCRPEFIDNIRKAIGCGTDAGIELFAPYVTYTKAEIIHEGYSMGVPFKETWTCYKGGERHCGICGSCDERKKSFIEAGIKDPTDYID